MSLTPATDRSPLDTFVADVRRVVDEGGSEQDVTQRVATLMRPLLAQRPFLDAAEMEPSAEKYVMYPLHVEPDGRFCVASAVWGVGQGTPIHDHGTWGVIGIYQGAEHEQRYLPEPGHGPVDMGEHVLHEGDVKVCCTSDADVHAVSCGSPVPCVGIHVYGGDIGGIVRHAYDPVTGDRTEFVSAWPESWSDRGPTAAPRSRR